jgi:acetyl-CoA carboxylase/biotin carboxylase 1
MAAYDHSRVAHFIGQSSSCLANVTNASFITFLGGNSLDKAPAGRVHDFVKANGGHTVITKVGVIRMSCHYWFTLTAN